MSGNASCEDDPAILKKRLSAAKKKISSLQKKLAHAQAAAEEFEDTVNSFLSRDLFESLTPTLTHGGAMEAVCERLVAIIEASRIKLPAESERMVAQIKAFISQRPLEAVLSLAKLSREGEPPRGDHFRVRVAKQFFESDDEITATLALKVRETVQVIESAYRTERARTQAQARLAHDPKQAAKAEARKLWDERHAGKHPKLRTNEQFAAECMQRWPVLSSAKVILGWCSAWNKEASQADPQPAS